MISEFTIALVISAFIGVLFSALLTRYITLNKFPTSHRVAILGYPQSGKTTLITSVFSYLFRKGIRGVSVIPRGDETIRRVNHNIALMEQWKPIEPTKDQDVFSFRAEVKIEALLPRKYKLEVGDFPGEDTVDLINNYGGWLHETPYFKWAMSADAFLFVIDIGCVLSDSENEYVSQQKQVFRAAWQRLQENHLDGASDLSMKPVIIVFSKADLLLAKNIDEAVKDPTEYAKNSSDQTITQEKIETKKKAIILKFEDLISYLDRENRFFQVVFTSAYSRGDDGPFGIRSIVEAILSKRFSIKSDLIKNVVSTLTSSS